MNLLDPFHFLRPGWLLLLLPVSLVWWQVLRRGDARRAWERWVDPPLLDALLVQGDERRRFRPAHLLGLFWLTALLALAGPAWQREPSPFAEETASLVIVLKVTPSMSETDIPPSRQERAAQKISDLMEIRPGARNGLVAYAGSAHLVMPLTRDAAVIEAFTADLVPELMPVAGDNGVAALRLAEQQLIRGGQPGVILYITDDVNDDMGQAFAGHRKNGGVPVHVWLACPNPSGQVLTAAKAGGGSVTRFSSDRTDVEQLARRIQQTATTSSEEGGDRWQDAGYGLIPMLVFLGIFWFRKGWVLG